MRLHRITALMARHLYLYRRSLPRALEIFYWPFLDLTIWGFITLYLVGHQAEVPAFVTVLPFVMNLVVTGWIIGLFATSLIMRFGQESAILAWSMVFLFQPISCVFYPLDVLPRWLQPLAWANPASHIFESMRTVLTTGAPPLAHLVWASTLNGLFVERCHSVVLSDVRLLQGARLAGAGWRIARNAYPAGGGQSWTDPPPNGATI